MKSSDIFAYNLKNLKTTCNLRGANRKRVLGEMEFMRTHEFKKSKIRPPGASAGYGHWVKRKNPIKKINFKCGRN